MKDDSPLILARTSGLSSGGFINLDSSGSKYVSKPSVGAHGTPEGTSVTVLKFNRSAIVLGPGGYVSARDGE